MEIQANIPQMLDKTLWSYPSFSSESEFRHKVASRGTSVAPETTGTPDGGNRILKPGKVLGSPIWSKTLVDVGQHFHVVGYGVCSHEDKAAHRHIIKAIKAEVECVVNQRIRDQQPI